MPLVAPAFAATSPFTVLLAYRAFRRVPPGFWEAARLEGASPLLTWWPVGLRLIRATTAAVAASPSPSTGATTSTPCSIPGPASSTLPSAWGSSGTSTGPTHQWPGRRRRPDRHALRPARGPAPALRRSGRLTHAPGRRTLPPLSRPGAPGVPGRRAVLAVRPARRSTTAAPSPEPAAGRPEPAGAHRPGRRRRGRAEAFQELARPSRPPARARGVHRRGRPGRPHRQAVTAFAGGAPPDVFLLNYRRLGPFVDRGVVAPARAGADRRGRLLPATVEAFTYDGELACLPQNVSSSVAYVNPALFARPACRCRGPTGPGPRPRGGGEGAVGEGHRGGRLRRGDPHRRAVRVDRRR